VQHRWPAKERLEDSMSFFQSPPFAAARSLGVAGLLAALVGCGTNPTTHPESPATLPARPAGDSATLPTKADAPGVGARAPAFTLKDQKGEARTLDEFLKKGKVALVFYRSARW
jgi:cytochrome oxidase Cu insertion factor (SCO1/SenC/PrrC family)